MLHLTEFDGFTVNNDEEDVLNRLQEEFAHIRIAPGDNTVLSGGRPAIAGFTHEPSLGDFKADYDYDLRYRRNIRSWIVHGRNNFTEYQGQKYGYLPWEFY